MPAVPETPAAEDASGSGGRPLPGPAETARASDPDIAGTHAAGTPITVSVGNVPFPAVLFDNEAANTFSEKYAYLSESLPAEPEHIGRIHAGDLMLYGDDCLVLFYDGFSTSYQYTPIGRLEKTDGLAAASGSGNVTIAFGK